IGKDDAGEVKSHFTLVAVLLDWRSGEGTPIEDATALGWFTPEEARARALELFPHALELMEMALAQKIKIPDVAVFLVVGMLIGPAVLGLVDIKADSALNQIILLFGASYILFDGGASLRLDVLKRVWITIVVIATVGLLITAAITSLAAYAILGVPWIVALMLGATIASTDP